MYRIQNTDKIPDRYDVRYVAAHLYSRRARARELELCDVIVRYQDEQTARAIELELCDVIVRYQDEQTAL
jgi:hypothetical protein